MTAEQFRQIIEREALQLLLKDRIPDEAQYDDLRDARKSLYMLAQGLQNKQSVEAVMRWIVVDVAERGLWAECQPDPTRWPDGFGSHGDFIQEALFIAGMAGDKRSRNIKSRLFKVGNAAIGAKQFGLSIDDALNNNWTQFRDGLPAIGRALAINDEDDAAEALEEILDDVQELSPRDFKEKYVKSKREKASTGTIKTTKQGVTIAVFVLNSPDDIERFSQHVGAISEWGLDADVYDNGPGAAVTIRGAQQVADVYREPEKESA
jgi:hypothetical protein